MAVASELRLPIYMLQLSSDQMTDDVMNSLLQFGMHDPPTILLLEDVDLLHTATLHRRSAEEQKAEEEEELRDEIAQLRRDRENPKGKRKGGRLTLSGLLNALDGPTATTGRLLFMTTNAKSRLDPALLRSGRIDYEVEFRHAEREQIQRLVTRFYSDFGPVNKAEPGSAELKSEVGKLPESPELQELARRFADELMAAGSKLTTADIQRHLLGYKKDPRAALDDLPTLLKSVELHADSRERKLSSCPTPEDKGPSTPRSSNQEAGDNASPPGSQEEEASAKDAPDAEMAEGNSEAHDTHDGATLERPSAAADVQEATARESLAESSNEVTSPDS